MSLNWIEVSSLWSQFIFLCILFFKKYFKIINTNYSQCVLCLLGFVFLHAHSKYLIRIISSYKCQIHFSKVPIFTLSQTLPFFHFCSIIGHSYFYRTKTMYKWTLWLNGLFYSQKYRVFLINLPFWGYFKSFCLHCPVRLLYFPLIIFFLLKGLISDLNRFHSFSRGIHNIWQNYIS